MSEALNDFLKISNYVTKKNIGNVTYAEFIVRVETREMGKALGKVEIDVLEVPDGMEDAEEDAESLPGTKGLTIVTESATNSTSCMTLSTIRGNVFGHGCGITTI